MTVPLNLLQKIDVLFLTKLNYIFCRQLKWHYVYTVYTDGVRQEHQYRKDLKVILGCVSLMISNKWGKSWFRVVID